MEYCRPLLLQRHAADSHSPYSTPRGLSVQSCVAESGPQTVLWPGLVHSGCKPVLVLVELEEVPVSPFLQSVGTPQNPPV